MCVAQQVMEDGSRETLINEFQAHVAHEAAEEAGAGGGDLGPDPAYEELDGPGRYSLVRAGRGSCVECPYAAWAGPLLPAA